MGAVSNIQAVVDYRTMRAVEQQLELMRAQAGQAPARPRPRLAVFFDRLLGIR